MTAGKKDLARSLAPTGKLRVALNFGNRVLVGRDADGQPSGISVDLAHELARSIGTQLDFVEFERAIDVADSAEQDRWDVCFLAVDPARVKTIAFTAPYVRISGCYIVGTSANVSDSSEVVAKGLRVAVVEGSAYTLHLSRQPGAEHLTNMPDIFAALAALDAGEVDAVAGIQQAMEQEAALRLGSRVLQPPFMQILQAMGVPAARSDGAKHLRRFVAERARSGRIAAILERHGVSGDCAVVPDAT